MPLSFDLYGASEAMASANGPGNEGSSAISDMSSLRVLRVLRLMKLVRLVRASRIYERWKVEAAPLAASFPPSIIASLIRSCTWSCAVAH